MSRFDFIESRMLDQFIDRQEPSILSR